MVQTRRSLSKSPKQETKAPSESTPRSRRQQTRNALRSQSTGVGIVIDTKAKKIVFDEEGNAPSLLEATYVPEPAVKPALPTTVGNDNDHDHDRGDDDDDDAVEEVKGSDAKSQIQEQRSFERSTARESAALLGPKRKRNNKSKKEDELDDDFFAQLDAEMEQQNKEQKKQKKTAPQGKLITFVAKDEVAQNKRPIQKKHNIQVVVLNDRPQIRTGPPLPFAGESSSSYSRLHLNNGQDELSAKQLQKMKKTGRKAEPTWTRSNQVNQRLLLGKQIPQNKSSENANRRVVIRL